MLIGIRLQIIKLILFSGLLNLGLRPIDFFFPCVSYKGKKCGSNGIS